MEEMRHLLESDPANKDRIFPYIGGEEVNDSPTHHATRFIINFGSLPESEARKWPLLMETLENKVKVFRQSKKSIVNPERWWMFARPASDLYQSIVDLKQVLVCPIISNKLNFTFLPTRMVYSHKLAVFAFETCDAFALLQSQVHACWAWQFSSTMKDDLNYSPSDCFCTFPFPTMGEQGIALEKAGMQLFDYRSC